MKGEEEEEESVEEVHGSRKEGKSSTVAVSTGSGPAEVKRETSTKPPLTPSVSEHCTISL